MGKQTFKEIGNQQSPQQTWKENWEVMKPFVRFSFKAMGLIAGALIGIIKLLPTLVAEKSQQPKKNDKIIKI
ncbi:MAG: hypothetical protein ACXVAY_04555 [Mucilaginibacter sp.]